ncbi:MAG: hypothetical protein M1838_001747 [Thelocarpon superellum]|nr:MAG: hypothetical protein M1838_001747 [Thelocarpon superellum]
MAVPDSVTVYFDDCPLRDFFSSNAALQEQQQHLPPLQRMNGDSSTIPQPKRKAARSPPGKSSLRRVAVEAQRSRTGVLSRNPQTGADSSRTKRVTAYCIAEQFDLAQVIQILESKGHPIDPCHTGLYSQVVHIRLPLPPSSPAQDVRHGDVFIFSSGTAVAWSLPDEIVLDLVTKTLLPAAENPHIEQLQTEDMDYLEDRTRENSMVRGDTITVGTRSSSPLETPTTINSGELQDLDAAKAAPRGDPPRRDADAILTKIAFSSGLARSTKLAVLETLLSNYFESTRSIPMMLSRGSRLPFTRSFILRKTGQLLSVRAQLNLYSELTDSLPDLFWDSRHELGLEGYYDQVGRALDVGVRIKILNEKMDYAQEIASVLRERLSEKHGLVLEWMIIALITIEVAFEVLRLWKESHERAREHAQIDRRGEGA